MYEHGLVSTFAQGEKSSEVFSGAILVSSLPSATIAAVPCAALYNRFQPSLVTDCPLLSHGREGPTASNPGALSTLQIGHDWATWCFSAFAHATCSALNTLHPAA